MRVQARDFLTSNPLSDPGNPVVRSVNMLHKHLKPIVFAIKANQREIPVEPETKVLVNELKLANLGYLTEGGQKFVIRKVIETTLKVFEQQSNNRVGSGQIAETLVRMEDAIADYFDLKLTPGSLASDIESAYVLIEEAESDLSDYLQDVFNDYAQHVFRELGRFNSLRIKIRKIERAIREAEKLESIISGLNLDQIAEMSRGDRELYSLLRDHLFVVVGDCITAFTHAGHELREAMGRWRLDLEKSIKRNELVDDFSAYFINGGSLEVHVDPSILPDVCRAVPSGKIAVGDKIVDRGRPIFYVDFSELEDNVELRALADQLLPEMLEVAENTRIREQKQKELMAIPLKNGEGVIDEEEPLFMEALFFMFECFRSNSELQRISAVESFQVLESGVNVDFWMSQVPIYLASRLEMRGIYLNAGNLNSAQDFEYLLGLELEYEEDIDPLFGGNSLVHDVIIKRKGSAVA